MKTLLIISTILLTSACGVRTGQTVMGSTSFLEAVNEGRRIELSNGAPMDSYTPKEKQRLTAYIARGAVR